MPQVLSLPWSTRKRGWAARCKTRASKAAYFNKLINIFEWLPLCAPRPPSVHRRAVRRGFLRTYKHARAGAAALRTGAWRGGVGQTAPRVPNEDHRVSSGPRLAARDQPDCSLRSVQGCFGSEVTEELK